MTWVGLYEAISHVLPWLIQAVRIPTPLAPPMSASWLSPTNSVSDGAGAYETQRVVEDRGMRFVHAELLGHYDSVHEVGDSGVADFRPLHLYRPIRYDSDRNAGALEVAKHRLCFLIERDGVRHHLAVGVYR